MKLELLHYFFLENFLIWNPSVSQFSRLLLTKDDFIFWFKHTDLFPYNRTGKNREVFTNFIHWIEKQDEHQLPLALEKLYQQHLKRPTDLSKAYMFFLAEILHPVITEFEKQLQVAPKDYYYPSYTNIIWIMSDFEPSKNIRNTKELTSGVQLLQTSNGGSSLLINVSNYNISSLIDVFKKAKNSGVNKLGFQIFPGKNRYVSLALQYYASLEAGYETDSSTSCSHSKYHECDAAQISAFVEDARKETTKSFEEILTAWIKGKSLPKSMQAASKVGRYGKRELWQEKAITTLASNNIKDVNNAYLLAKRFVQLLLKPDRSTSEKLELVGLKDFFIKSELITLENAIDDFADITAEEFTVKIQSKEIIANDVLFLVINNFLKLNLKEAIISNNLLLVNFLITSNPSYAERTYEIESRSGKTPVSPLAHANLTSNLSIEDFIIEQNISAIGGDYLQCLIVKKDKSSVEKFKKISAKIYHASWNNEENNSNLNPLRTFTETFAANILETLLTPPSAPSRIIKNILEQIRIDHITNANRTKIANLIGNYEVYRDYLTKFATKAEIQLLLSSAQHSTPSINELDEIEQLHRHFLALLQNHLNTDFISKAEFLAVLKQSTLWHLASINELEPYYPDKEHYEELATWVAKQDAGDLPQALEKIFRDDKTNYSEQYQRFLKELFKPWLYNKESLLTASNSPRLKLYFIVSPAHLPKSEFNFIDNSADVIIKSTCQYESASPVDTRRFQKVFLTAYANDIKEIELYPEPGHQPLVSLCLQYYAALKIGFTADRICITSEISEQQQWFVRNFVTDAKALADSSVSHDYPPTFESILTSWMNNEEGIPTSIYKKGKQGNYGKQCDWQYKPAALKTAKEINHANELHALTKRYVQLRLRSYTDDVTDKEVEQCVKILQKYISYQNPDNSTVPLNAHTTRENLLQAIGSKSIEIKGSSIVANAFSYYFQPDLRSAIDNDDLELITFLVPIDKNYLRTLIDGKSPLAYALSKNKKNEHIIDYLWRTSLEVKNETLNDLASPEDLHLLLTYALEKVANGGKQLEDVAKIREIIIKYYYPTILNALRRTDKNLHELITNNYHTILTCLLTVPCAPHQIINQILNFGIDNNLAFNHQELIIGMASGKLDCHYLPRIAGDLNELSVQQKKQIYEMAERQPHFLREFTALNRQILPKQNQSIMDETAVDQNKGILLETLSMEPPLNKTEQNAVTAATVPQSGVNSNNKSQRPHAPGHQLEQYITKSINDFSDHSRLKTAQWLKNNFHNVAIIQLMHAGFKKHNKSSLLYRQIKSAITTLKTENLNNSKTNVNLFNDNSIQYKILMDLFSQLNKLETSRDYKYASPARRLLISSQIDVLHTAITLVANKHSMMANLEKSSEENIPPRLKQAALDKIKSMYVKHAPKTEPGIEALFTSPKKPYQSQIKSDWIVDFNSIAFFSAPTIQGDKKISMPEGIFYTRDSKNKSHSRQAMATFFNDLLSNADNKYKPAEIATLLYWSCVALQHQNKSSHLLGIMQHNLVILLELNPAEKHDPQELYNVMLDKQLVESKQTCREKIIYDLFVKIHDIERKSSYKNDPTNDLKTIQTYQTLLLALVVGNISNLNDDEFKALQSMIKNLNNSILTERDLLTNYKANQSNFSTWCDQIVNPETIKQPSP